MCDTEDLTNWVPHRRPIDQFQAAPIPDARGAFLFFFSPDGQSIGFATREGLKKIPLAGGTPVTLYEGPVLGGCRGSGVQSQFDMAAFNVSRDGTLVFLTGDAPKPAARTLTWITRQGHEEPFNLAPASYGWPRVAPDGRHVALDIIGANGRSDIWLYDVSRRTLGRLTDDLDIHLFPVWTKDSQHVVFTSGPPFSFFVTPIDGRASSRLLATTNAPGALAASDWSSDGQFIVFSFLSTPRMGDNPAFDIGMLPANGGGPLKLLLHSDAAEVDPDISPDGNWIVYSCNRTGRYEIYVERFPDLGERQIVSTNGGVEPLWAPSGTEIFYRNIDGRRMLAVPFDPRSGIPGRASTLFEGSFALYLSGLPFRSYDVSPDARRFVMVKDLPRGNRAAPATEINVVMNWSQELTRRVPVR